MSERIARRITQRRPGVNGRNGRPGRPTREQVEARLREIEAEASQPVDPYSAVERLLGRPLSAQERLSYLVASDWRELLA